MITIVEPKEHIVKLLGMQKIKENETYRLMRYVLRVDHDEKVLLHNVVTGQLVVLTKDEASILEELPVSFNQVIRELMAAFFLVPETYDEHVAVVQLRHILRRLYDVHVSGSIDLFTILPTTTCNARCYYCFEHGVKSVTMTEKIASDVIDYICNNSDPNKVIGLRWFGGEPTVAANRIDQICKGLQKKNKKYTSVITTNGYLFDEDMVKRAKTIWRITSAHITIDGTKDYYIRTKNYRYSDDNPYERVMRNIELLIRNEIFVQIRMNFDRSNYQQFYNLADDIKKRFGSNPYLHFFSHPINDVGYLKKSYNSVDDEWYERTIVELNNVSRDGKLYRQLRELPNLEFIGCMAINDSTVTITPEGQLVRCSEQFGDEQFIGDIWNGVTKEELIKSWRVLADYETCQNCFLFPHCVRPINCLTKNRCNYGKEYIIEYSNTVRNKYEAYKREDIS